MVICCTKPDVVLGCEDELIVENPLRFVVKAGARVELDNLGEEEVLLQRLVYKQKRILIDQLSHSGIPGCPSLSGNVLFSLNAQPTTCRLLNHPQGLVEIITRPLSAPFQFRSS